MRATATAAARTLPPGALVYPTGNKSGLFWEVADENDNVGWVLHMQIAPSDSFIDGVCSPVDTHQSALG